MKTTALVTRLTPELLSRLESSGRCDEIAFFSRSESCPAASSLTLRRISFRDRPQAYVEHLTIVYDWVEALFEKPDFAAWVARTAAAVDLPERELRNALKKASGLELAEDGQLYSVGETLYPDSARVYYFAEPDFLRRLLPLEIGCEPAARGDRRRRYAALLALTFARLLAPARGGRGPASKIYFEQAYDDLLNTEFPGLYRYLKTRDDVVYGCKSADGEIAELLRRDGKPVLLRSEIAPGFRARWSAFRRLLAVLLLPSPSFGLRYWTLKLFRHQLSCEALFSVIRPEIWLKVRSDIEPFHPITSAVARRNGCRHAGYSGGSYPFPNFYFAWLDYDFYGILGPAFADIFGPLWKDAGRLIVAGPFTVEVRDHAPATQRRTPAIGVFPTSVGDDFYMQEPVLLPFYRGVIRAAAKLGARLIIKVRVPEPKLAAFITEESGGKVPFEIVCYQQDGVRAQDVLEGSDLVAVLSTSTTAWEALALSKKLAVFEQDWVKHPFDGAKPALVARDEKALEETLLRLAALTQDEYERQAAGLIDRQTKRCDGALAREFIESIEHES